MQIIKKTGLFFTLLLLTTTFNTYTMEPEQTKKIGWVALAGAAIIGGAVAFNKFLSYIHSKQIDFYKLPEDVRNEIISLLTINASAKTLEEAAFTINSLAQVNQKLNALINEPQRCLQIIKHLAQKFNCSDEIVAKYLKTKEAKRRLELQSSCMEMIINLQIEEFNDFYDKHKNDIDLNFTYQRTFFNPAPSFYSKYTLLEYAIKQDCKENITTRTKCLLNTNAINITIDMIPKLISRLPNHTTKNIFKIIQLLCTYLKININQLNKHGSTILLEVIGYFGDAKTIIALLNAGADPELANIHGHTPLQAAQKTIHREVLINIIQDAIDKKHEMQEK